MSRKDVEDRILALENRQKDGLDSQETIDYLKQMLEEPSHSFFRINQSYGSIEEQKNATVKIRAALWFIEHYYDWTK